MVNHLTNGLYLILMLSLPVTLTAAFIGLIIGILQAVTQVQEQTISAAPKILSVFLLIIFGGGVMMTLLTTYLRESAIIAFQEVPASGTRILPPQYTDERQARIHKFFKNKANGKGGHNINFPSTPTSADGQMSPEQGEFGNLGKPRPKKSISEDLYLKGR